MIPAPSMTQPDRLRCGGGVALLLALALLAGGCSETPSPPTTTESLSVEGAWIPAPPPGAPAAAYLTIENGTDRSEAIVGAASPAAERVEIHQTSEVDGVMRMAPLASIDLPAGGKAELRPRGIHLMLIGPRELAVGDRIPLSLETARGERIESEAIVRAPGHGGPAESPLDHGEHSGHH